MRIAEPTRDEAFFLAVLTHLIPGLAACHHEDPSGALWMTVSCDLVDRRSGEPVTWRLDYDGKEISAGRSPAHLTWDHGRRAEVAGVDLAPPLGLRVDVSSPGEAAELAAAWFKDRQRSATRPPRSF